MEKIFQYDLSGMPLTVSVGKLAEQANGACLMTYGETVILVTATASSQPRDGIDFFPLSVEYAEKSYSVGKIPGGFIKREGRPSEKAVLNSRLIDRPIRPLFPEGYRNDVQIIASVLSVDPETSPEIVAMIGSSIALSISDIPFNGPTGSVNVGMIDGEYIINPNGEQRKNSDINLTVSGTEEAIMMVEAGSNFVTEKQMLDAILFGHEEIKKICRFIKGIQEEIGLPKLEVEVAEIDAELRAEVEAFASELIVNAMNNADKMVRQSETDIAVKAIKEKFAEVYPDNKSDIATIIDEVISKEFRRQVLIEKVRPDGRAFDEVRPISTEVGLIPRTHGSGLFTRGQTQVLSLLTLGSTSDVQIIDDLGEETSKRYIHHYNFPPFSVGDTRPVRSPGRREIGHGALAEKALLPVIPSEEEFPYTIRIVSEVLSSNGSSSQASVCGSSLALMDAGVPIKKPVAGIAMGLVKEGEHISILTDIQGLEDHLGDMDFKVAGTDEGITAIQMDIKIGGIDEAVLTDALEEARKGRMHILGKMNEAITEPRTELSKYAPLIFTMSINPEKIGEVIGPGGKMINKIIEETAVKIDIDDDGKIFVVADSREHADRAMDMINEIVKEVEVGEIYEGIVKNITNFGAFVEVLKGKEGLLHISNIAHNRVAKVEDVLKLGDVVKVKVMGVDKQGKIDLSRKILLPKEPVEEKTEDKKGE